MITPSDVPSRWRKKSPNGFRRRLRLFSCSMGRLKESSPVILLLLLFPLLLHQSLTKHKVHVDVYEWKCGYCRKSFNEDKFLDQHFATRHFNLLNTNTSYDNSVMLIPVLEKNKPFPRGGKKKSGVFYLAVSILTLMLLPLFYLLVFLHQRCLRMFSGFLCSPPHWFVSKKVISSEF
ncbi:unnamed protein product [Brassica oleracea var. botrytis]|uniref:(rape) hypothetical protein n=1 Tax=Brassica napus TaxID=3708 RepID=A0A816LB83_BRANA|nr:unnamed protein product [Brassica napus]